MEKELKNVNADSVNLIAHEFETIKLNTENFETILLNKIGDKIENFIRLNDNAKVIWNK